MKPLTPWILLAGTIMSSASEPRAVITPMVPFFQKWQMSDGVKMVDKTAVHAAGRIHFCITLQALLEENSKVSCIGLYQEAGQGKSGNAFHPADAAINSQLIQYLNAAFSRAVHHRLDISLLLHLNSHGEKQDWRNNFDFDPLHGGKNQSYRDAMIRPILRAIKESVPADWPVDLSLQGEMGTTVFRYPEQWKKLYEECRLSLGTHPRRRVGMSFNYNSVAGNAGQSCSREKMRALWDKVDFIGISLYHGVSSSPKPSDFDYALGSFAGEFQGIGCPLPPQKPIHIVEIGIGGGGQSKDDWQPVIPAPTSAQALASPYLGTHEIQKNPWALPELAKARRDYFNAFLEFASLPRERHPIEAISLWSFGSWDVHGIETPIFGDAQVSEKIRAFNQIATKNR